MEKRFDSDIVPIVERRSKLEEQKETLRIAKKWALERLKSFPPKIDEAKARALIVADMSKDLKNGPMEDFQLSWAKIREKITNLGDMVTDVMEDSITGEKSSIVVEREGVSSWIIGERRPDGTWTSQARITDDGQTELTLHYDSDRYRNMGANMYLTLEKNFPRATLRTASLLIKAIESRTDQI